MRLEIGGRIPDSEKEEIKKEILHYKMPEVEGEEPKSEFELKLLAKANEWLIEKFRNIGIEVAPFDLTHIHILNHGSYSKFIAKPTNGAISNPIVQHLYFDNSRLDGLELFDAVLHEAVHSYSFTKIHIKHDEEGNRKGSLYRSGYSIKSSEPEQEELMVINEGVIDLIVGQIIEEHSTQIQDLFKIGSKKISDIFLERYYYRDFIVKIIKIVSTRNNISEEELGKTLISNLVSGNMMHLRLLEKTLGKGFLRKLSNIGHTQGVTKEEVVAKLNEIEAEYLNEI